MARMIRIDDDIYECLKKMATPFEDTPNTVLRKILHLPQSLIKQGEDEKEQVKQPPKRKKEELTPQPVYEEWLLFTLWDKFKGRAKKVNVTEATISNMQRCNLLKEADFGKVKSGETKAVNTIAWARNRLKDEGLISPDSPFGFWELTEKGIERAKKIDSSKINSLLDEKEYIQPQNPAGHVFEYRVHNAKASMIITELNLYSILKGSTAVREEKGSIPEKEKRKRNEFIQSGILVVNARGLLEFTKNVEFTSASAAASLIAGSSKDGLICFKDRSGIALKQYLG